MSRKTHLHDASAQPDVPCWKVGMTLDDAKVIVSRYSKGGGSGGYYFCPGCQEWHVTSHTQAIRRGPYKRQRAGGRRHWQRRR